MPRWRALLLPGTLAAAALWGPWAVAAMRIDRDGWNLDPSVEAFMWLGAPVYFPLAMGLDRWDLDLPAWLDLPRLLEMLLLRGIMGESIAWLSIWVALSVCLCAAGAVIGSRGWRWLAGVAILTLLYSGGMLWLTRDWFF